MNPLLKGEQAVLGAVLMDPGQLEKLSWLSPRHFYRPAHRALFAAMRKLHTDAHPAFAAGKEVPLAWVTDTVAEAGHHVRGLTASYAHTLIAACPRPGHAPVYGRMVLEGAIHRTVAEHATRLHQAARADAVQGEVEGALHHADVLADVLFDLARRWGTEPRPLAPTTARTAPGEPSPISTPEAVEDERFLLAVLVDQPRAVDEIVAWLRPGDFADPAHGQLYRCLGALHHRGEPIDQLTVLWETQRRGLLADGTLTADQVSAICDGLSAGSAEFLGERIMRGSVVRAGATSARAIRDLAEDHALTPGRLISHALHALGPLNEIRARWETATGTKAPTPAPAPSALPSSTRVDAALARSKPRRPMPANQRLHTPPVTTPGRPPSRSHP